MELAIIYFLPYIKSTFYIFQKYLLCRMPSAIQRFMGEAITHVPFAMVIWNVTLEDINTCRQVF